METVRIAMLNTDLPVPNVRAKLGTYGTIFHRLLSDAATRISPTTKVESADFDVVQGEYPVSVSDFDAILITGSAASAYDNVEWIRVLDEYVLNVYQHHPRVKMFGSCFGHQLICQSLLRHLGVVVEKDPNGWELGRPLTPDEETSREPESEASPSLRLQFVHADHVKIPDPGVLPPPWTIVGSSDHCAVQGVYEKDRVFTLQGHFEFDRFINTETIKVFGALWKPDELNKALEAMNAEDDAERAAEMVMRFLMADVESQANVGRTAGLITPPAEIC
ncbi:class I glutamine amidotransferase-like protein [Pestalotiopsis sp. NC0098]|nr:class I glutamine amidotransferase-like protein [Pestalotiopsis sp. NC0098]